MIQEIDTSNLPDIDTFTSGIFDKNGIEVKIGDTLILPYIDPMGGLHKDEPNKEVIVRFKHGCFGYETQTSFIPLMNWSKTKSGEYVPNCEEKTIILDEYLFWIKNINSNRQ